MKEKIEKILAEVKSFHADSKDALEQFRIQYLSKKGTITELFTEFKQVAPEMRKEMGMRLNELKNTIQDIIDEQQKQFETKSEGKTDLDLSLPVDAMNGSRHPLSIVREEINDIFIALMLARAALMSASGELSSGSSSSSAGAAPTLPAPDFSASAVASARNLLPDLAAACAA